MNHREMHPDEAIDRVLTGLRKAEPLDGMQQRLLRTARERAGARRRWSLKAAAGTTSSWAVAATAMAMIALAASWMLMRSHRTPHETAHAVPAHLPSANAPVVETRLSSTGVTPMQPAHRPGGVFAEKAAAPIEPVSDEDALAISEMLAPSKPAPPLPLTHQEMLLAEVVHQGDPVELAMLDPKMRSSAFADSRAAFADFFAPPAKEYVKPPKIEGDPTAPDSKPATTDGSPTAPDSKSVAAESK